MIDDINEQTDLFNFDRPVIKGYPELKWTRKSPYKSTQFFPAQLKERYGLPDENGWINKIFWGDNLQVMSHLLRNYRGQIDLVYIDPPFDSKADYKKTISLRGKVASNDSTMFEDKQYGDIWSNDDYLQFMYERLVIIRELMSEKGSIFLHCDSHKSHHLRCLLDEVFGPENFVNEIIWRKSNSHNDGKKFGCITENIFFYSKSSEYTYNKQFYPMDEASYTLVEPETGRKYKSVSLNAPGQGEPRFFGDGNLLYPPVGTHWRWSQERINEALMMNPPKIFFSQNGVPRYKQYMDEMEGNPVQNLWIDFMAISSQAEERLDYPTQKPEQLLERIILTASNEGDLVFDCFMGSGTTQAVSYKLNRRFLGADINLGAIQTTTKRLAIIEKESRDTLLDKKAGFEVYNVNNYDFFRNPDEAKNLIIEALGIQAFSSNNVFDGELDGRHVKILPVDRIATKADLNDLVAKLPYKTYDKIKEENPNDPVDKITLVCMGHEPDLRASFQQMVGAYKVDILVVDILRDKSALEFKREAQAKVILKNNELIISSFYPMNLLQKLSIQKENVEQWNQLVDSVMIDYNYDGSTLKPQIIDVPEKNELVKGNYKIPSEHGKIRIKITDLLSESLELEVE